MHRSPSPIAVRAGLFAVLLGGLSLACAQSDIAGPDEPALEAHEASIDPGFVKCRLLSAVSVSKYVSPGVWDTLRVGPHKLIFRPGSLSQKTLITASFGADSSRSIRFGPEGLKFNASYAPTLQMNVSNCGVLSSTMNIVYSDDKLRQVKETRSSVVNLTLQVVSAAISHFSRYAVHH